MNEYFAEFEVEMEALAATMREEYANRSRVREQAFDLDDASSVARVLYRADNWLQRVTETVLASFA